MAFKIAAREMDEQATARLAGAPEGSINRQLSELPVRQREWPAGMVLFLPRTGLVVVPVDPRKGYWGCVVVAGSATYPVGGNDLAVSVDEIKRGIRLDPNDLHSLAAEQLHSLFQQKESSS